MKSIYKKISVGVLAAGLLVGGSGLVQGGQAFASKVPLDNYRQSSKNEIQVYVDGWLKWYMRPGESREQVLREQKQSNLRSLDYWGAKKMFDYKIQGVQEVDQNLNVDIDGSYKEVLDFVDSLSISEGKGQRPKGVYHVQIGLHVFKIMFN